MATYDELENSTDDGQPVALYIFRIGEVYWFYTSADQEITWSHPLGGNTQYMPVAISDNGTKRGNSDAEDFTITLPHDTPLVALYRATAPSETMWVTAKRLHEPLPASAPVYFVGTVTDVSRPRDTAQAQIRCKPITASFERGGLRLSYSRNCPHVLYDNGCKANKELHKFEAVVSAVTGNTFTLPGYAGSFDIFKAGFAKWDREPGLPERRGIISAVTDGAGGIVCEVIGTTDGMIVGTAMTIYEGCPHTPTACETQFNNMDNYGGFPHLPAKSPFDGDPVF